MQMSEFANWMNRNNVVLVSIAGSTSISNQFNDVRARTRKHLQSPPTTSNAHAGTHAHERIAAFMVISS